MTKIRMIVVSVPASARLVGQVIGAFTDFMPSLRAFQGWLVGQLVLEALGLERGGFALPYVEVVARTLALCERAHHFPGTVVLERPSEDAPGERDQVYVGTDPELVGGWGERAADLVRFVPHTSPRTLEVCSLGSDRLEIRCDFTERPSERIGESVLDAIVRLNEEEAPGGTRGIVDRGPPPITFEVFRADEGNE